jgi:putative transposase
MVLSGHCPSVSFQHPQGYYHMPGPQPQSIIITAAQQTILERLLRQHRCPQALARRIKIVLAAAAGRGNEPIARALGCSPTTVRLWRSRWAAAERQLAAADADEHDLRTLLATVLADAPRPGRPDTFTAEQLVQIIALACTSPADAGRPIQTWTPRELADEAVKRQIVPTISPTSVGRFLKAGQTQAASQSLLVEHDRT